MLKLVSFPLANQRRVSLAQPLQAAAGGSSADRPVHSVHGPMVPDGARRGRRGREVTRRKGQLGSRVVWHFNDIFYAD